MPDARVALGFTLNLGSNQYAKALVELADEGKPGESVEEVYQRVMAKTEDALADAIVKVVERLEAEGWVQKLET
jgi:hypothetical protein